MPALTTGLIQSYSFRDERGFQAVTRMFFPASDTVAHAQGDAKLVAEALVGVTLSATVLDTDGATSVVKSNGVYTTPAQAWIAAGDGAYSSIADKLVLIFNDSAGRPHRFQIPCPDAAIFSLGDHVQAQGTNAALALLVSQMLARDTNGGAHTTTAAVCSAEGYPLVAYSAGYRSRRKTPRRMNTGLRQADGNADIWP